MANALFGEMWGWQALVSSPQVICLQAVKQKWIWPGTEGCACTECLKNASCNIGLIEYKVRYC